jgi:capsular exopolysaccharide synthesis family protein
MSVPAENLGSIVQEEGRLVALAAPDSAAAEQYRILLSRIDRAAAARTLRMIAITSCARGEGRTVTASNLAITAGRDGRDALLVECDLRRPTLGSLFDLPPGPGLAEVVEGRAELPQALRRVGGLTVLPAGDAMDIAAVLRSPRLATTFETLRSSFSFILLDLPPALALSDAGRLATSADGIVLVVRAGETPRDVVRMAIDSLPDRLLGIVLNDVEDAGYHRYLRSEAIGA